MNEQLTITTERVDDVPLLIGHMIRMGLVDVLDDHFPTNGNWQGRSLGEVTVVWLAHILSQANHRLSHVAPWAAGLAETLQASCGQPVREGDLSMDRLVIVLRALAEDARWSSFETALGQRLVRVYALGTAPVRLDTTTLSGHWVAEGIMQFGHSKDHRPDLPQVKVALATLDPLGLPLVTTVVPGDRADDPLYVPLIREVQGILGPDPHLYVGDAKMSALATRAYLQASGDRYLCPLAGCHVPAAQWTRYLAPVWAEEVTLETVTRTGMDGQPVVIAAGRVVTETLHARVNEQEITWAERRLVVRSSTYAEQQTTALRARLTKAEEAIRALTTWRQGKRQWTEATALQDASTKILEHYRVTDLLQVIIAPRVPEQRTQRGAVILQVDVVRQAAAIVAVEQRLGWRVYATNAPATELTLEQGVLSYREEYVIEHGFGRLKGVPLSLAPSYLHRPDHVVGLIRLLSIGLRVLTTLDYTVRRQLADEGAPGLVGLYRGRPKQLSARPTTERLLAVFEGVTLTVLHRPDQIVRHLSPLSDLQQRILALAGFDTHLYLHVAQGE